MGFEPMHKGFADLCLTTWRRRRLELRDQPRNSIAAGSRIVVVGLPTVAQVRWRGPPSLARILASSVDNLRMEPERRLERETGFEPATSTLARSHSTTELFPLAVNILL